MTRRSLLKYSLGLGALGVAGLPLVGSYRNAANTLSDDPANADQELNQEIEENRDWAYQVPAEVQQAIDRGLRYLAQTQNRDGSFGDRYQLAGNIAVTALASLAFMAGGHMPGRGQYGNHVMRALEYVISKEKRTPPAPGLLCHDTGIRQIAMYSHGFGLLFLGEVFGMIPDAKLQKHVRGTIQRAIDLISVTQNSKGGWRYEPIKSQADISVTITQIMALRSVRNAGFFVEKSVIDHSTNYVKSCQSPSDGGFSYYANQGPSAFARSAAAVVALYCAGIYKGREITRGLDYLMQFKPGTAIMTREGQLHYFYGHYYAAQAMWTAGGNYWRQWYPAICQDLLNRLPSNGQGAWIDSSTCSHYATAMATIILQIPNNYLPILQK